MKSSAASLLSPPRQHPLVGKFLAGHCMTSGKTQIYYCWNVTPNDVCLSGVIDPSDMKYISDRAVGRTFYEAEVTERGWMAERWGLVCEHASITREEYLLLQKRCESLEMANAAGQDTPAGDKQLQVIDIMMKHAPWMLHPDDGCIPHAPTAAA